MNLVPLFCGPGPRPDISNRCRKWGASPTRIEAAGRGASQCCSPAALRASRVLVKPPCVPRRPYLHFGIHAVPLPTGSDNALPIASSGCLLRFPLRLSRVRQAPLPPRPDSAASGVAPLQARRSILCYRSGWVWLASGRARRRGNLGHSYETQLGLGRKTAGPSHDGRKVARVSRAKLPRGTGGGPTVGVCGALP